MQRLSTAPAAGMENKARICDVSQSRARTYRGAELSCANFEPLASQVSLVTSTPSIFVNCRNRFFATPSFWTKDAGSTDWSNSTHTAALRQGFTAPQARLGQLFAYMS